MTLLGNGLSAAGHNEDALSVYEAELAIMRRVGASESDILVVQNNLAGTYYKLGRLEQALSLQRDVYSGYVKLSGEEHQSTLIAALNYSASLKDLERFEKAKALLRKKIPVARRVLGENDTLPFRMRKVYAGALYEDPTATLNDLREAVTTLKDTVRTARRVLGTAHPDVVNIERALGNARAALSARDVGSITEAFAAM